MSFDDVRIGVEKTAATIPTLRAFKRAAWLGVVLPTGDALDTQLPTFVYISLVSLLDDGLDAVIDSRYPGTMLSKLANKIDFLESRGELKDAAGLHRARESRNAYAHEFGRYAAWDDVDRLLQVLTTELRHLKVL